MNNYNSWADTLNAYLQASNEDDCFLETFTKEVLPQLQPQKVFNWLEVGCGNGIKTIRQLEVLKASQKFEQINLHIVEPSPFWYQHFQMEHLAKVKEVASVNMTFSNFEQFIATTTQTTFHYISFIHVLYDCGITKSVINFIDSGINQIPCFILATVETTTSDFYLLRQILQSKGIVLSSAKGNFFVQELEKRQIDYNTFLSNNKSCHIDLTQLNQDDRHWIFPFIIGCSESDFTKLPYSQKQIIWQTVRQYITKSTINPEDITYLAYITHSSSNAKPDKHTPSFTYIQRQ